jgi:hypothetical protein
MNLENRMEMTVFVPSPIFVWKDDEGLSKNYFDCIPREEVRSDYDFYSGSVDTGDVLDAGNYICCVLEKNSALLDVPFADFFTKIPEFVTYMDRSCDVGKAQDGRLHMFMSYSAGENIMDSRTAHESLRSVLESYPQESSFASFVNLCVDN